MAELDEKTKAMLKLIEEDADSFAQRAEMYYKKRPDLINLVEEFYRAYRSLAERYDQLKGEIRQNVPKAVQVQYGLSGETPPESPFGKQNFSFTNVTQGFQFRNLNPPSDNVSKGFQFGMQKGPSNNASERYQKLFVRQESCGSDSEASEVDDPEPEVERKKNRRSSEDLSPVCSSDSEVDNPVQETEENKNVSSRMREMQITISNLQEEKARLLKQLSAKNLQLKHSKDEINKLKKDKSCLKEEMSLVAQEKNVLQTELDTVQAEHKKLRNQNEVGMQQMQVLAKNASILQEENNRLSKHNKIASAVLRFVSGEAASLARSNARLRNDMWQGNQQREASLQILKDEKNNIENMFEAEEKKVFELNLNIAELQGEVYRLGEENRQQQRELLDRNEEKREVIRQLCFALETLRDKNQRLEEVLRNSRGSNVSTHFSRWKRFLFATLDGPGPQRCILAI
eukprot:Gb_15282 [translate_table: standard]